MAALPANLQPGDTIANDYRIVESPAEGGMGCVYVAEQLSTGKQRALEIMHPHVVRDEKLRSRLQAAANDLARLRPRRLRVRALLTLLAVGFVAIAVVLNRRGGSTDPAVAATRRGRRSSRSG